MNPCHCSFICLKYVWYSGIGTSGLLFRLGDPVAVKSNKRICGVWVGKIFMQGRTIHTVRNKTHDQLNWQGYTLMILNCITNNSFWEVYYHSVNKNLNVNSVSHPPQQKNTFPPTNIVLLLITVQQRYWVYQ